MSPSYSYITSHCTNVKPQIGAPGAITNFKGGATSAWSLLNFLAATASDLKARAATQTMRPVPPQKPCVVAARHGTRVLSRCHSSPGEESRRVAFHWKLLGQNGWLHTTFVSLTSTPAMWRVSTKPPQSQSLIDDDGSVLLAQEVRLHLTETRKQNTSKLVLVSMPVRPPTSQVFQVFRPLSIGCHPS